MSAPEPVNFPISTEPYKAPFNVEKNGVSSASVVDASGRVLATTAFEDTAYLFAASPDMLDVLESTTKYLIAMRDSFYDSFTNSEGEYDSKEEEEIVKECDLFIDQMQLAVAVAKGGRR